MTQELTNEFVLSVEAKMYNEPSSTAGLHHTDVDLTPCTLGKVPLLPDLVRHHDSLNKEILSRHLVPFMSFQGRRNKRTHPLPRTMPSITGKPFHEMTWTDKKDLLMVDKEQRWAVENLDGDIANDFDPKSFAILDEEVEFDFTGNSYSRVLND